MRHVPVLLAEVLDSLQLQSGMNVVDCTLGDAGHAEEILKRTGPHGKLLGIDADAESLMRAKNFLHVYQDRIVLVRDNFVNLASIVVEAKFTPIHGILLDLGWSSPQFEERGRGFSFQKPDEPLDMRYDSSQKSIRQLADKSLKLSASELVNTLDEEELRKTFREYGEEKLYKEIAHAIVHERKTKQVVTVLDLVTLVLTVYRNKTGSTKEIPWIGGLHPATRVFQALRIAVNDELGVLRQALPQAVGLLAPGSRLAVISFHSLEDRIVKQYFQSLRGAGFILCTKKPIVCSDAEGKANPRARSAKLRVIEKQ